MADIVERATRSRMMAGIRGKNTGPELALRRALHARGLRFRLYRKDLPGRPDIVLPGQRAVVFVHGCFWHRHEGCRFTTTPATRPEFWQQKFDGNLRRDREALAALSAAGWRTAVVWECYLRENGAKLAAEQVVNWLQGSETHLELPNTGASE